MNRTALQALVASAVALLSPLPGPSHAFASPPSAPATPDLPDAARRLRELILEREAWNAREFPESAFARGDYSRAQTIADESLAAIERRHAETVDFLARLRAVPPESLPEADRLDALLLAGQLADAVEAHRHRRHLAPVGGRWGPHQSIAQMHERVRFDRLADYENFLRRLSLVPQRLDQVTERLRLGLAEGRTPPRVTIEHVPEQIDALLGGGLRALESPWARLPPAIDRDAAAALLERLRTTAIPAIEAALRALRDFLADIYLPGCAESIAAIDQPDGAAWYASCLRHHTTTGLSAEEIHAVGLREVARLRGEMLATIRRTDFLEREPSAADLDDESLFRAFVHDLRTNPRFYHRSEAALLAGYRDICKRVDGWLPKVFGVLPRQPYGVRPIPRFMAASQTTAYYQPGDMRNGEPGWFFANTFRLEMRPTYEMVPLALHEAVPGHHLQIALSRELEGVPEFRRESRYNAFVEGWALYAESLGIEHGMYDDPYDDFGRLLYDMWRSCRLVVDPGMHALGWSRERAVAFMLENTALSELNVRTEIDRYIGWPGQACGYKIGELAIRAMRAEAERRLGERFDLRKFHDELLGAGALPLDLLEARMDAWTERMAASTEAR